MLGLHASECCTGKGLTIPLVPGQLLHVAIVCAGHNASRDAVTLVKSILFHRYVGQGGQEQGPMLLSVGSCPGVISQWGRRAPLPLPPQILGAQIQ